MEIHSWTKEMVRTMSDDMILRSYRDFSEEKRNVAFLMVDSTDQADWDAQASEFLEWLSDTRERHDNLQPRHVDMIVSVRRMASVAKVIIDGTADVGGN